MSAFPPLRCPCCGTVLEPRLTHAEKPYYMCDPCGVQLFIRRREGIERLKVQTRRSERRDFWREASG